MNCIACGKPIPEGRQVCLDCEQTSEKELATAIFRDIIKDADFDIFGNLYIDAEDFAEIKEKYGVE